MSSPLEKFILDNRSSFDADSPDSRVWEKISEKLNPEEKKVKLLRSLPFKRRLIAAAAVVLLAATAVLYYSLHSPKQAEVVAGNKTAPAPRDNHLPVAITPADSPALISNNPDVVHGKTNQNLQAAQPAISNNHKDEAVENKEMYYYAKLIEIKHEELKALEKDEPLLYRQFAGDVQKLDSVYYSLKIQLPDNTNREQVIEAMISNLQLQIGLLNKQLKIIKQIKHSKKSAYEKAYKSV